MWIVETFLSFAAKNELKSEKYVMWKSKLWWNKSLNKCINLKQECDLLKILLKEKDEK